MKRLCLLPVLAAMVLLLSACPDTKLPKPTPKVPQPKASAAMVDAPSPTILSYELPQWPRRGA